MKKDYVKPVATKIEIQLDENIADSPGVSKSGGFRFEQVPMNDCYKYMSGYDVTGSMGFSSGLASSEVMSILYGAVNAGVIEFEQAMQISTTC